MTVQTYVLPQSSDKSAVRFFDTYACASVQACTCVCEASCCAGNDKGGSRGLELIKCNDAMWGDLAVFVLIKKPPPSPAGEEERGRETEYDREMKTAMRGLNYKKSLRECCQRAAQRKSRTMQ